STYGATEQKVKGAKLQLLLPYENTDGRLFTSFGTSNYVSFATKGDQLAEGMQLLEWLSIKENHDLLQYGVEGTDWNAVGDLEYELASDYVFPGYTMSWQVPLERRPKTMIESEKTWLDFVQDFDNFELSPIAGFALEGTKLKTELAQFSALTPKLLRPVQAGKVDPGSGVEAMKRGFSDAGLAAVIAEVETQLAAFFAAR
ncbi:MAG TPA: DUF3502 domain-containing protein, partial [Microlunatus sp.]|nr:DUF3502 domain-containing protein [Microlunatus sp.]